MFGLFRPTCPCDPAAKSWLEERLGWLARQVGLHILLEGPIILPTDEFFPDPYDRSPKAVRRMFPRVCTYIEGDPDAGESKRFTAPTPPGILAIAPALGLAAGRGARG